MSTLDPLLTTLSQAPNTQIDSMMTAKIKRLIGCHNEIVATELKEILEYSVAEGLVSDFAANVIEEAIIIAETK